MNIDETLKLDQRYYDDSVLHRNTHKCGGYPYSNGSFLTSVTRDLHARSILEIGTAIGYSAYCFARGNAVEITTVDLLDEHKELARSRWSELGVENQIECIVGDSRDVLPKLDQQFDIVFFDGFAPNSAEVSEFVRHLKTDGLLISTNLSWNTTSEEYLSVIEKIGLESVRNGDTSLSSAVSETLQVAQSTWKNCEADTKKRGAHL